MNGFSPLRVTVKDASWLSDALDWHKAKTEENPIGSTALSFVPFGVGSAQSALEGINDFRDGNYLAGTGNLLAAGVNAIPGGGLVTGAGKGLLKLFGGGARAAKVLRTTGKLAPLAANAAAVAGNMSKTTSSPAVPPGQIGSQQPTNQLLPFSPEQIQMLGSEQPFVWKHPGPTAAEPPKTADTASDNTSVTEPDTEAIPGYSGLTADTHPATVKDTGGTTAAANTLSETTSPFDLIRLRDHWSAQNQIPSHR